MKEIFTLRELSQKYNVSYSRLTKATANKEFEHFKQGKIFVKESAFLNWLTSNRVPAASEIKAQSKIPA